MNVSEKELEVFLNDWPDRAGNCKSCFVELQGFVESLENAGLEFHARPGVSYSLRGMRADSDNPLLFVMVDVIDDAPRWLSVCFYGQKVTDPKGWGDYVPGGLLGEDGICFDLEGDAVSRLDYLKERINEAYAAAVD